MLFETVLAATPGKYVWMAATDSNPSGLRDPEGRICARMWQAYRQHKDREVISYIKALREEWLFKLAIEGWPWRWES